MEALGRECQGLILDVALKSTVLLLIVMGLAGRWRSAACRALVWCSLLATLLCLPLAAAWQVGPELRWAASLGLVSGPSIPAGPELRASAELASTQFLWTMVGVGLYLAGVVLALGRVGAALWQTRRLRRCAQPLDGRRLETWRARMGVRVPVEWAASDRVRTPVLLGWRRPLILVPAAWPRAANRFLNATLAHELAHVRRGDHLWNLVGLVATSLYWFHPLVHLLRRRWRQDIERTCDDWAVLHLGDARSYGHVLLVTATASAQPAMASAIGLDMARVEGVTGRVERLLQGGGGNPRPRVGRCRALCAAVAVALVSGCFGGAHPVDPSRAPNTTAVTAEILADGSLRLNGVDVPIEGFLAEAVRLRRETGTSLIDIRADGAATEGLFAGVMDMARRAGFVDVECQVDPVVSSGGNHEQIAITAEVFANGNLRLNGQDLSFVDFPSAARRLHAETGSALILIRVDERTAYSNVNRVMEAARRAGLVNQVIADQASSPED